MRRWIICSLSVVIPALVLTGCGGSVDDDDADAPPRKVAKAKVTRVEEASKPVKGKGVADLTGVITLDAAPNLDEMTASLKKSIGASSDANYCTTGRLPSDPADFKPKINACESTQQTYRVGANKGLGNVFVWIEPDRGFHFEVPADQLAAVPKEVTLSQPHCAFLPHCLVLFPRTYDKDGKQVETGQKFVVKNDARVGHNAKVTGGPVNQLGSRGIQPDKQDTFPVRPDAQPVKIACDVHGWMNAYVRAFDHPYATVSSVGANPKAEGEKKWEDLASPDVGKWVIKGAPVGAKVKLKVWHEDLGFIGEGGAAGKVIEIKDKNDPINVTAKGK